MAIDWNTEPSTNPTVYKVAPGEYTATFESCEVSPYSDDEKPVLEIKMRIPSENAIIDDRLRFYAGALPIAISKVQSLGINTGSLPSDDLDTVAKIIDQACHGSEYTINCKDNNYNPEKPRTDINSYQKIGETPSQGMAGDEAIVAPF